MDKGVREIRLQQWITIIKACNDSGLTKTKWCRDNGVNRRQFNYWQRKIRTMVLDSEKQASSAGTTELSEFCEIVPTTNSLVPKSIQQDIHKQAGISDSDYHERNAGITVECGGCRILVNEGFSEKSLSSVLKVIRNA